MLFFYVYFLYAPVWSQTGVPGDTLRLRINFIIIQKEDGSANFDTARQDHMQYLGDAVQILNDAYAFKYRKLKDSSCMAKCTYQDSGIRFRHHKTVIIRDDSLWNNDLDINYHKCPNRNRWLWLGLQRHLDSIISAEDKGINIYFTVSKKQFEIQDTVTGYNYDGFLQSACSMFPSMDSTEFSAVHHPNAFLKYRFMQNHPYQWGVGSLGRGMAHELGHSLDLRHVYDCDNIMNNRGSKGRTSLQDSQVDLARKKIFSTNLIQYLDR